MRPRDRRIHRYRPVHQPLGVGLRDQRLHDRVPGAFGREPAMPGPHGLPRAEHCRKIAPRDPAPIPVNDPFQHRPRVRELPTRATRRPRQHPIDQRPLSIRKQPKPRHRSSVSTDPLNLCQTRPRPHAVVGGASTLRCWNQRIVRSGVSAGRRSPISTSSTCATANSVLTDGFAGVPGRDSPFSSF